MHASKWLFLVASFVTISLPASPARAGPEVAPTGPVERYISIDNVCAWPNLTVLRDGTIIAAIFNRPSHGLEAGMVEAWASGDGRFWEKRGIVAPNEPNTTRMNVAAGLAGNGDLVVLCSGWSNQQQPGRQKQIPFRDAILPAWVCRSSDGGRTWTQDKEFVPPPKDWEAFVPFGDIVAGTDGALHASAIGVYYDPREAVRPRPPRVMQSWHFRSADDGRTWSATSVIGPTHNETFIHPLGGKRWLAVAREESARAMDLFHSDDDGKTWGSPQRVTGRGELNAHLLRLKDGRLLLSYGNRAEDRFGVLAKTSSDDGRTWSNPIRLVHSLKSDCGYPSSVQRPDGAIVTAYYSASTQNHTRYHMGVVIWNPPTVSNPSSPSPLVSFSP